MDVQRKLEILADAAKYDASCASSGTEQRDSRDGKGLGSAVHHQEVLHRVRDTRLLKPLPRG
jgi:predicted DNA-binding helix-hairpin-helix protein